MPDTVDAVPSVGLVPERRAVDILVPGLIGSMVVGTVIATAGTGSDYRFKAFLLTSDLIGGLIVIAGSPLILPALRTRRPELGVGLIALVVGLLVPFAANPSVLGALTLLRLLTAALLVIVVTTAQLQTIRRLHGGLVAATGIEVVLAVLQRVHGGGLGLDRLGENTPPLLAIGGGLAPMGTLPHPYVLAGLGLLCAGVSTSLAARCTITGRWAAAGVVLGAAAIGLTTSRASVLALPAIVVPLVVARARRTEGAHATRLLVTFAFALGLSMAAAAPGWLGRAKETATDNSIEATSNGRVRLLHQAALLTSHHLVVGVGPGRYSTAVSADPEVLALADAGRVQPVHDVPLLILAEGGIFGLLGLGALTAAVARSALRAGWAGVGVFGCLVPVLLLDHMLWTFPHGMVLVAVWFAAAAIAADPIRSTALPTAVNAERVG